jgi:hypothetical protein
MKSKQDDQLILKGQWWIPGNARHKVEGVLSLSETAGANLDLMGRLLPKGQRAPIAIITAPALQADIVHGLTYQGEPVTLVSSFETSFKRSLDRIGGAESTVTSSMAIVGAHFRRTTDITFNELSFGCTFLSEWFNQRPFETTIRRRGRATVKYLAPSPRRLKVNDGLTVELFSRLDGVRFPAIQTTATLHHEACFTICFGEDVTFGEHRLVMNKLRQLLALALARPVYLNSIRASSTKLRRQVAGRTYPVSLAVYIEQPTPITSPAPRLDDEMLFCYDDIRPLYRSMIRALIMKYDRVRPLFDSHVELVYNPTTYVYPDQRFLGLVHGLETFHRKIYGGTESPPKEHRKRISRILRAVEPIDCTWLKERLTYSNEMSLRRRLNGLLSRNKIVLNQYVTDQRAFVDRVVRVRNGLVHGSGSSRETSASELLALCSKLEVLNETALLAELGVPLPDIWRFMSRCLHRRYRWRDQEE